MAAWFKGDVSTRSRDVLPTSHIVEQSGFESESDQEMDEEPEEANTEGDHVMTCKIHPQLEMDMYCRKHDEIFCKTCAEQRHG